MVSIIIPIYNSEKSIIRCVSSLMNQTYHEIEIILVNDGHHLQVLFQFHDTSDSLKKIHNV